MNGADSELRAMLGWHCVALHRLVPQATNGCEYTQSSRLIGLFLFGCRYCYGLAGGAIFVTSAKQKNDPQAAMSQQQEYQVTARKWRPAEFDSVVGQEHVTQTLRNAIRNSRMHHAYLFCGPRGVGKTTTARILAKSLNCLNPGEDAEPCNACESCQQITSGRSMDVVEIDGASNNSVDDIRKLRDNAKYPPVSGRYKLYIIDEVHMLSTSAFNALLKTLEEPPKHLIFVFATTEPHKVPATILSRCQRFDFRRMQIPDIVGRLRYIAEQEKMEVDDDALVVVARKADGSMRDAQSIFDQVTAFCGTTITYHQANDALNLIDQDFLFRVTDMMRTQETAEAFAIVEHLMRVGYDPQEFLISLAEHLRNYLTVITAGSTRLIEAAKMHIDRYAAEARNLEQGDIIRALHLVLAAQQAIRTAPQPRLRLELALVQLAVMDSTVNLAQLLQKIDQMPDNPNGGNTSGGNSGFTASIKAGIATTAEPSKAYSTASAGNNNNNGSSANSASIDAAEKQQPATVNNRVDLAAVPAAPSLVASRNLAAFPTAAPASVRTQPIYTSDPELPTLPQQEGTLGASLMGGGGGIVMASGSVVAEPLSAIAAGARAIPQYIPPFAEVQHRWQEFAQTACSEKKLLATTLMSAQPFEIVGSTLRICVAEETQATMLNRSREMLNQKLREFFQGAALRIESIVGMAPQPLPNNGFNNGAGAVAHRHPFLTALTELLHATPL